MSQFDTESLEEAGTKAWDNMSDEQKANFYKTIWDAPNLTRDTITREQMEVDD